MRCVLVSHTHWDREWYRTFQAFRARLVDAIDRLLELCAGDPGYRFLLDGQSIVLEDYLEIRPERRAELEALVRAGRIAIGPWYVQPDSLLPSGEAHVRNLLEGRRVAETFGPASRMGYTPDSFGHPAQFPQLYRGFGLEAFIYWRGNPGDLDELPSEYLWRSPDGTEILACHLAAGYFGAAHLPRDLVRATLQLRKLGERLAARASGEAVLFMNGVDHQLPDPHTAQVAESLEKATGWRVERGLLDDFVRSVARDLPRFSGELVGGRSANLLPGVWSARSYLKLANRACETALEGWAEPWAALGARLGLADERPALRVAWRELLRNQAHDSICGCSQDRVHDQMGARYDAALELADETARRALERLAGQATERQTPWDEGLELAVFNPSPWPRSDVVRFQIDPEPATKPDESDTSRIAVHPLLLRTFREPGFAIDGEPVRAVPSLEPGRNQLVEKFPSIDLEWVARDVPAFGWRRLSLRPAPHSPDAVDDGREIAAGDVRVAADAAGALDVTLGGRHFAGLTGLEDVGDRGDTYDFDPVAGGELDLESVLVRRERHPSGIERLRVERVLRVPASLEEDRERRSSETVPLRIVTEARVARGVERVDLVVRVDNTARDHRLRLLFPTGAPVQRFDAATTFDVAARTPGPCDADDWVHPPPATFPQQGFVHANGLCVAAPGLVEGEVLPDGTIALTLLRAVGWLARLDPRTRPIPAGPAVPTPGAQCPGPLEAHVALLPGLGPRAARDAELGLRCVVAGDAPLLPAGEPLLRIDPPELLLSALKPAERSSGLVVRLLNPSDAPLDARLRSGFELAAVRRVRLDEEPDERADETLRVEGREILLAVPPHALRSLLLEPPA